MTNMWMYVTMMFLLHSVEATRDCASLPECKCTVKKDHSVKADCSGLQLSSVPVFNKNVTRINLSHNNFSVFPKASEMPINIVYLDMSYNFISNFSEYLIPGKFSKLTQLNLSGNRLKLNYDTYPKGLFIGLKKLKWINLKNNTGNYLPSEQYYPSDTLSDLSSLKSLLIDGLDKRTFGVQFTKLKLLKQLDLSGATGICSITVLNSQYFAHFPNLQTIDISSCGLLRIENGTFKTTKFLKNLDISFNEDLTFRVLSNVTYDLQFTDIRVAKANKIHRTFGTGTELFVNDIKYIRNTSVEKIYLDSNRLEVVEFGVMQYTPPSLKYVSVADNKFTMGIYLFEVGQLSEVREFNGSYSHGSHNPIDVFHFVRPQSCDRPHRPTCDGEKPHTLHSKRSADNINRDLLYNGLNELGKFEFRIPRNLEIIHFRRSSLRYTIPELTFSANKIKFIDFSGNVLDKWIGPIRNVKALKYLDLSNNYCSYVSDFFFDNATNLETLFVSENLLGFVLNTDEGNIFKNLRHLKKLDISQNRIQNLHPQIFKGTSSLQHMNISNNLLRQWDFEIRHLQHLKYIDMSNNQIEYLSASLCKSLDDLNKYNRLTLDLKGNNFACTCITVRFLKWMRTTSVKLKHLGHYSCRLTNGTDRNFQFLDEIIQDLEIECMSKLGFIIGTSIGILIALSAVIGGIVYRYRWKIRYLYYMARNKNRGYTPIGDSDSEQTYDYDMFVSYADDDRQFVKDEMIRNLEQDRNLRLCIHHRDFIPGLDIAANITNAIHNSRKTVVILSPNFLKSYWCRFEFNMARMEAIYSRDGKDILFLVFLKHTPTKELPLMIMELIESQSYIEYPNDPQGNIVFWEKIKEAVLM